MVAVLHLPGNLICECVCNVKHPVSDSIIFFINLFCSFKNILFKHWFDIWNIDMKRDKVLKKNVESILDYTWQTKKEVNANNDEHYCLQRQKYFVNKHWKVFGFFWWVSQTLNERSSPALCVGCRTVWTPPPLVSAGEPNSGRSTAGNPCGHWGFCRFVEADKGKKETLSVGSQNMISFVCDKVNRWDAVISHSRRG